MAEWIEEEKVAPSWCGFLIARCSKCGKYVCTPTINNEYFNYKFCPHCGKPIKYGVDECEQEEKQDD